MKILAIRGMNLASLDGEFEIDFEQEPLRSAGIFAITGNTGAGKSTILDAISLALYAEVPRLLSASNKKEGDEELTPKDARRILRRGKGEGYAEVDFEAMDGKVYRSRWEVRRAGKKPDGRIQGEQISVVELGAGVELQGNNRELKEQLERLIGLSFDQFRRTILLAQGDFAAFLKAEEKEKTQLLEKVTGTDIYRRISMRLYERNREEQAELEQIESWMKGIVLLPEETLEAKKLRLEEVVQERSGLGKRAEQLKGLLSWFEERERREQAIEAKSKELVEAMRAHEGAEPLRKELAEVESVLPIAPIYKEKQEKREQLEVLKRDRKQLEQQQQGLLEELKSMGLRIEEATKRLEVSERLHEESLPKLKVARQLDGELLQKSREIKKQQEILSAKSSERLGQREEALEAVQEEISRLEKRERVLQHSLSAELSRMRSELIEGEPCPVCGSVHHPAAGTHAPIAEEEERRRIATELLKWRAKVEGLREEIGGLRQRVQQEQVASEELSELEIVCQTYMIERSEYFGGRDADEVEREQRDTIKSAQAALEALTKGKSDKVVEEKGVSVKIEETEKQIATLEKALSAVDQAIDDFLGGMEPRMSREQLDRYLVYDAVWVKQRKGELTRLEERLKEVKLSLAERHRLLQEHLNREDRPEDDTTLEMVEQEQVMLETLLAELGKEDKAISLDLASDSKERERLEGLRAEQEKLAPQAKLWAQLNDLFGSANGDKFAKIAQRYTISNLLGYANKQLEIIAPRYRLKQVDPDSLNLVVVDTYMMNEERTVFSLSGGETFLVSLSLALGLSSLSSRHVSIRSLFIDEGFGSLDADTLAIALDALETLQSQQGRKIGVISHVQEMNERIATQIHVKSNGSGGSNIIIKG